VEVGDAEGTPPRSVWKSEGAELADRDYFCVIFFLQAGFTRTRLEHSQTVVERLNRIELALFEVPASLSERIESENKRISEEMQNQFQKLESAVEQFAEQAGNEDANLKEKLDNLHDKIADISMYKRPSNVSFIIRC